MLIFSPGKLILPEPKISRIKAISNRARVKPIPIPNPSNALLYTVFFEANASARPKIIQFTVIRGRYTPKTESEGIKAFTTSSTIVTNEAITTMNAGIRIVSRINDLKSEIITLEHNKTKVTAT